MRISFKLTLENNVITVDYRRKIVSIIKNALTKYENGKYFSEVYGDGVKRDFSFSVNMENPIFKKDIIEMSNNVLNVELSTPNNKEGIILFNALLSMQKMTVQVSDMSFTLSSTRLVHEKEVSQNVVTFKVCSPIILRKHQREGNKDWYISCKDVNFGNMLKENIHMQLEKYNPYLCRYIDDLQIDTTLCKKAVVVNYGQYIECTIGIISFYGEPKLLNSIYKTGLGVKKSLGFGLISIVE